MMYNLEDRLINFAYLITEIVGKIRRNPRAKYLANQLMRSGCSAALNYGEAQAAESRADFIHKMKVILKELRESQINLKVISKLKILESSLTSTALQECSELVAIFATSVKTAKSKLKK